MELSLPILSLLIWTPILGGIWVLYVGDRQEDTVKLFSFIVSILVFIISVYAYSQFDNSTSRFQFIEFREWIPVFNINYHLGVDGIAFPLILLTTFTTMLVILSAWEVIEVRVSQFMAAFLILE